MKKLTFLKARILSDSYFIFKENNVFGVLNSSQIKQIFSKLGNDADILFNNSSNAGFSVQKLKKVNCICQPSELDLICAAVTIHLYRSRKLLNSLHFTGFFFKKIKHSNNKILVKMIFNSMTKISEHPLYLRLRVNNTEFICSDIDRLFICNDDNDAFSTGDIIAKFKHLQLPICLYRQNGCDVMIESYDLSSGNKLRANPFFWAGVVGCCLSEKKQQSFVIKSGQGDITANVLRKISGEVDVEINFVIEKQMEGQIWV
jgi:hypothetical protein